MFSVSYRNKLLPLLALPQAIVWTVALCCSITNDNITILFANIQYLILTKWQCNSGWLSRSSTSHLEQIVLFLYKALLVASHPKQMHGMSAV